MKTNRTCLTQHRNEATGHSFEVWEEVDGSIVPYVDGNPAIVAQLSPSGNPVWTPAEYAGIIPVAGKFYFVGA